LSQYWLGSIPVDLLVNSAGAAEGLITCCFYTGKKGGNNRLRFLLYQLELDLLLRLVDWWRWT
jgi:hypothetical protein